MINLMTLSRRIATVMTLSFAIALLSGTVVAQKSFDSFPTLESHLDFSDLRTPAGPSAPEDLNVPQDMNVLTRGPLHEAFASAHQANPQPSALIFKAPPELIEEVAPEYKPEGNNVQWISGYWAWDDAQSDFIWISGIWRDVPPNRRWIAGYWHPEGNGHRWVSGIWAEETQLELGYLPDPPASLDQGPSTPPPGQGYSYSPGHWDHQDDNYRWCAGHWQPMVENRIWIPACYVWTPEGCVYRSGYWDYEIQDRGTCFAPVQFTEPVYLENDYCYRPSYAINLNVDFLTHLFVRPDCGHYFYGDWYGSNFNNVHYKPWVSFSSHFRNYDPLLSYYSSRPSPFDRRYSAVQYLARQHNFYANNRDYRPRPTYQSQLKHVNKVKLLHASGSRGQQRFREDFLGKSSYVHAYKNFRAGQQFGGQQQTRQQFARDSARRLLDQQDQARRSLLVQANRTHQDTIRRAQEQSRRIQQQQQQRRDRDRRAQQERSRQQDQARRNQRDQDRRNQQAADRARQDRERRVQQERSRQRDQARRNQRDQDRRNQQATDRARQDRDRRVQQERSRQQSSQRDKKQAADRGKQDQARRVRQAADRAKQDQARRNQQAAANRGKQDQARRAQQERSRQQSAQRAKQQAADRARKDQTRRNQQAAANRAKQDQARRNQQKAQQERSRQQAAQRAKQQQAQRDSAKRAQQKSQRDAAKRAQANRQKAAQKKQKAPVQQSRSSRLRNRSVRK